MHINGRERTIKFFLKQPLSFGMQSNKIKDYSFNFWNRIKNHNYKCTRLETLNAMQEKAAATKDNKQ